MLDQDTRSNTSNWIPVILVANIFFKIYSIFITSHVVQTLQFYSIKMSRVSQLFLNKTFKEYSTILLRSSVNINIRFQYKTLYINTLTFFLSCTLHLLVITELKKFKAIQILTLTVISLKLLKRQP